MYKKRSYIRSSGGPGILFHVTFSLLLLTGQFTGCEPENLVWKLDCDDCVDFRPDSTELIIYLTVNQENNEIPVTVYEGSADGKIFSQDTVTEDEFYLMAAIGPSYTVKAEYRSGPKTILVFDEDKMRVSDYGDECGDPCFMIKGGIFNNKLKE
jgi:hypothetical protein